MANNRRESTSCAHVANIHHKSNGGNMATMKIKTTANKNIKTETVILNTKAVRMLLVMTVTRKMTLMLIVIIVRAKNTKLKFSYSNNNDPNNGRHKNKSKSSKVRATPYMTAMVITLNAYS